MIKDILDSDSCKVWGNKREKESSHAVFDGLNEGPVTYDFIFKTVSFVKNFNIQVISEKNGLSLNFKAKDATTMISKKKAKFWFICFYSFTATQSTLHVLRQKDIDDHV